MITAKQREALELMINADGWRVITEMMNESRKALYQEALHGVTVFDNKPEKLSPTERTERLTQIAWLDYIIALPENIIQEHLDDSAFAMDAMNPVNDMGNMGNMDAMNAVNAVNPVNPMNPVGNMGSMDDMDKTEDKLFRNMQSSLDKQYNEIMKINGNKKLPENIDEKKLKTIVATINAKAMENMTADMQEVNAKAMTDSDETNENSDATTEVDHN